MSEDGTSHPGPRADTRIVALAGGVGAARLLRGLIRCVSTEAVDVVVNTGDDREFYGVHVSPDLDIVTYTLAEAVDSKKGYGLTGDAYRVVDRLAELGHEAWFRLGDVDLANSLHRTLRLRAGAGLAEVTDELRRSYGVPIRLLPMSEDPCPTLIELSGGTRIHFEEYLARDGAPDDVRDIDLSAAAAARPGPGVVEAIRAAEIVLICPSNPVVSVAPILAVPGIRAAIEASAAPVVAISPIVGGAPIKGPAAQLMRGVGAEVSALGVARLYREIADALVIDRRDAELLPEIEALGLRTAAVDSLMVDAAAAERLARAALALATPGAR